MAVCNNCMPQTVAAHCDVVGCIPYRVLAGGAVEARITSSTGKVIFRGGTGSFWRTNCKMVRAANIPISALGLRTVVNGGEK